MKSFVNSCNLLGLGWLDYLLFFLAGCLLVPIWFWIRVKEKRKWNDYYEMTAYMELLLCSFKRAGHIKVALQDCRLVFRGEGKMGQAVDRAIHILESGETTVEKSLIQSALNEMLKIYNCRRMKIMHHFICRIERMGGDVAEALDILLADLEMWKRRFLLYHKKKQYIGKECILAALLAMALCSLARLMIPIEFRESLDQNVIYRISTIVVTSLLIISAIAIRYVTGRVQIELAGERKRRRQVEREFPYWLLSVTLYLQQNRLYYALLQSAEETEGVFRREIYHLVEAIYQNPTSLQPYLDFFSDLDLPELRTGMKLLYAVNTNGYQDTKRQVHFLVEQNNAVLDRCEKEYYRIKLAGLRMLRQIPMMLAGGKIMLDMVIFLMIMADTITIF